MLHEVHVQPDLLSTDNLTHTYPSKQQPGSAVLLGQAATPGLVTGSNVSHSSAYAGQPGGVDLCSPGPMTLPCLLSQKLMTLPLPWVAVMYKLCAHMKPAESLHAKLPCEMGI